MLPLMRAEDEDMTPTEISRVISEGIEPGTMGLIDEEDQKAEEQVNPQQVFGSVRNLAAHMRNFADALEKEANATNADAARATLAKLNGAVRQAYDMTNALCDQIGLPKIETL